MAYSTGKNRTWAIWLLAFVAVIAGLLAVLDTLRLLGLLPTTVLGQMKFYSANWFGAILWNCCRSSGSRSPTNSTKVDPRGWLFVVVIAVINLIFLFLAILGQSTFQAVTLGLIVNAAALILALLPSTKEAFNMRK